ncbi:hypothetical protein EHQ46_05880 [Leptospira yanagawae]|uniref:Uncharacterized protein n=1 Tax=Leptospira yanagawae TaxID=293069 RepID=A0ABY2M7H0_9LEPT|nr:hypothetical protein [Leptospira yanagawae]TGL23044.1 hypothetical protein EHQ46_05880 [Leptospira yanagawae]
MKVKLFGKKNQTNLRIDSQLQSFLEEIIKRDFLENKTLIAELTISSIGVERLLSKLNLSYSQGVGVRKYEDIEFILIQFQSNNLQFFAFYEINVNTSENKFKVDFFSNTATNFNENTINLKAPILIICNQNAIFYKFKNRNIPKIFLRFVEEEYNRHFELIKFYFDFLILPRKYFTNEGIVEITSKIRVIFDVLKIYAFIEEDFVDFLKLKKYKFLIANKGIFVQPRNDLELILLYYLESIEKNTKI